MNARANLVLGKSHYRVARCQIKATAAMNYQSKPDNKRMGLRGGKTTAGTSASQRQAENLDRTLSKTG
jgi:hypothetical protein